MNKPHDAPDFTFSDLAILAMAATEYATRLQDGTSTTPTGIDTTPVHVLGLAQQLEQAAALRCSVVLARGGETLPLVVGWQYYVDDRGHPKDTARVVLDAIHGDAATVKELRFGSPEFFSVPLSSLRLARCPWLNQNPAELHAARQRAQTDFRHGGGQADNPFNATTEGPQREAYAWEMHRLWAQDEQAAAAHTGEPE